MRDFGLFTKKRGEKLLLPLFSRFEAKKPKLTTKKPNVFSHKRLLHTTGGQG